MRVTQEALSLCIYQGVGIYFSLLVWGKNHQLLLVCICEIRVLVTSQGFFSKTAEKTCDESQNLLKRDIGYASFYE